MRIGKIEALGIIERDRVDLLDCHKGFLCEGDLPFRPPIHKDKITVWPPVDIHPSAKIGKHVMIGRYTNICGDIEIGDYTRIQGFCFIPEGRIQA
ncbi:unnamed protein product, partial [marine sediment metagenome]